MSEKLTHASALLLRREDTLLAMREAKKNPWLCVGLDSAIMPCMLEAPPAWIPQEGARLPARDGTLVVLRRETIQAATAWPWLLCALERPRAGLLQERPSSVGAFAHFGRRAFVYCALLCWREGRTRSAVDENGFPLRLLSASTLARATMSMKMAPAGAKLGAYRRAHAPVSNHAPETLGTEPSAA